MPTKRSMLTVDELFAACLRWKQLGKTDIHLNSRGKPTKLRSGGKEKIIRSGIKVWSWRTTEGEDDDGDIYKRVTCKARDQGPTHDLEMIFYGSGRNAKVALDCSCEYYRYYCEVALFKNGSARLDEPIEMKIWSNGADPKITNEDEEHIICKHLYAALKAGAADKKPRGISLEDQRKLAAKERKKGQEEKKREEKVKTEKLKKAEKDNKIKREPTKTTKTTKKPPEIKEVKQPKRYATPPQTKWKKSK